MWRLKKTSPLYILKSLLRFEIAGTPDSSALLLSTIAFSAYYIN